MKSALVMGAGGFIGHHLVNRLAKEGYNVTGVDLKYPEFGRTSAHRFVISDLRHRSNVEDVIFMNDYQYDEIYQLAADMGGAGYIFSGENDASIMHNSATINLNLLDVLSSMKNIITKVFYSSSACIYPEHNQKDPNNPNCEESSAYPANPDSEYGWEKLFSERLYLSYARNYRLNVRIGRYHNIYGPLGTYKGGKEKAPAAICRKVAELPKSGGSIEVWGDGKQTRSFLYIDDCIQATRAIMDSDYNIPFNVGSEEMVTINQLVDFCSAISGKKVEKKFVNGFQGVRGRNSHNKLIESSIGWSPKFSLWEGLGETYPWIEGEINGNKKA